MQGMSRSSMGGAVTAPEGEDVHGLPNPSSGISADAQSVPIPNIQRGTIQYSTVQYSKVPGGVPDTPESSDSDCDSQRSVADGGGCNDTDSTIPLTRDGSVESEPTCKASLVPAVGTNGMADQSAASSQGSRNALSQKDVAAESAAGTSGGQLVAAAVGSVTRVSPACYEEQEASAAERGQSAATFMSNVTWGAYLHHPLESLLFVLFLIFKRNIHASLC